MIIKSFQKGKEKKNMHTQEKMRFLLFPVNPKEKIIEAFIRELLRDLSLFLCLLLFYKIKRFHVINKIKRLPVFNCKSFSYEVK